MQHQGSRNMSGRILIIDPVSTNRIVLRVKMLAAQYVVDVCEKLADARAQVQSFQPDLILINLSALSQEAITFCRDLRRDPVTQKIAQVGVGVAIPSQERMAALGAGVDDVMPAPINDALLMSRVRSLLRQRSLLSDLIDKDGSCARYFGFGEARQDFARPYRAVVLCEHHVQGDALAQGLAKTLEQPVIQAKSIGQVAQDAAPDVVVISGAENARSVVGLSELISDLRARHVTRRTAQLVIVPRWAEHQAAMALDLGADDVVFDDTPRAELALRITRLARQKGQADVLRAEVQEGLRAAVTDPLTGLHNRRYANGYMQRLQQSASSCGQSYAMILLDIDHFKSINDQYGHEAGDRVLAELGHRLNGNLGPVDLCARIGGEEFLIVVSRAGMSGARLMAEKLRCAVAAAPFDIGGSVVPVTVSAGVAVYDPLGGSAATEFGPLGPLYAQADAALYAAKSAGRDAVSCAQSAAA